MGNFTVQLVFNDGSGDYILPLVQSISDPQPGMKATVIKGVRADGAVVIPGGKESAEIKVRGILFDSDGYSDITTLMATMRSSVTTLPATLTLKHWTGSAWTTNWAYSVRRIDEINFSDSEDMRTVAQPYEISFLIISY